MILKYTDLNPNFFLEHTTSHSHTRFGKTETYCTGRSTNFLILLQNKKHMNKLP